MENSNYNHIDLFIDFSIIYFKYNNNSKTVVQNFQLIGNHVDYFKSLFNNVYYRDNFTFIGNGNNSLKEANADERIILMEQPAHPLHDFLELIKSEEIFPTSFIEDSEIIKLNHTNEASAINNLLYNLVEEGKRVSELYDGDEVIIPAIKYSNDSVQVIQNLFTGNKCEIQLNVDKEASKIQSIIYSDMSNPIS